MTTTDPTTPPDPTTPTEQVDVLAIVGSTALGGPRSRAIILDAIRRYRPKKILSGGADGIDKLAAAIGRELGLEVDERFPDVQSWHDQVVVAPDPLAGTVRKGFRTRNLEIAVGCGALVRIAWDEAEQIAANGRSTYGSGWTRDRARVRGVPTEEYVLKLADDGVKLKRRKPKKA